MAELEPWRNGKKGRSRILLRTVTVICETEVGSLIIWGQKQQIYP